MADRPVLVTPGGVHVRVHADRVAGKLASGWRRATPKPTPRRRKPAAKSDDE